MNDTRCPDCAVTMEETTLRSQDGFSLTINTGKRSGLLGKLGVGSTTGVDAVCCPECGLVRLYADLE
ncbi:hypothetical protein HALLA_16750 [Halostagnicola larsenii XH-48]|uniref:Small CPxCG-related zinc finger protein n=1 Tax=Halostagnicola larsenii XH-48 TaxID=797299 RepID=W0JNA9_9EURY|nr:hypothetical protein [Halostagnicola larsenii]AHG00201.1 hypothetical protein HALLA_16750 [Halostagnicola larsenii XH-48]